MAASIRLSRARARWRDRAKAYRVLIDGVEAARIGDGETAHLPVEPGNHSLRLRVDWSGSRELTFTLGDGQEVGFSCRPNTGLAIWLLFQSVFVRDRWVILEPT